MKIVGSLLIIISTVLCSYLYEKQYKERIAKIKKIIKLIDHISSQIEYFSYPITEIIDNFHDTDNFILSLINKEADISIFDDSEKNLISSFFSNIGKGYKKEEIALCEYTSKALKKYCEAIEKDYSSKTKVFRSISIFIGACTIILLV